MSAWRAAKARYGLLRYAQIIPVALLLWATDAVDKFRAGAAGAGLRNALEVVTISRQLGGEFTAGWNAWLAGHPLPALAAAWYYIVLHGAVAGVVGILLIWRSVPSFRVHRNALIASSLIGLAVFLLYPVAPPRMLPGVHDVTGAAVPVFSSMLESKAASQFAALPSLHVTWALWAAVAATALLRRHRVLRLLVWLYPAATILDVLATGNHYLLDVILAPGVLVLAYAVSLGLEAARSGQLAAMPAAIRALPARYPALPALSRALRRPRLPQPAPDRAHEHQR